MSKEIVIAECGPALFEMDDFIGQCVDEFLKKHRLPIIENIEKNSKFNVGHVMDRLAIKTF